MNVTVKINGVWMTGEIDEGSARSVYEALQKQYDREDVENYAINGYGECENDKGRAFLVRRKAENIAKRYRKAMDEDETWFYVLDNVVWLYFQDNIESEEPLDLNAEDLKELWLEFEHIPINDQDEIEEKYLGFAAGTNRFDIWGWFDARYPGGVAKLSGQA